MSLTARQKFLVGKRRIVVKVGSSLLAQSPVGMPAAIADELKSLMSMGVECVVVSSGAIALGLPTLGFDKRPSDLPSLQAAAAVGQNRLLQNWEHAFAAHGTSIAQILLTHEDLAHRGRFLNARHALRALLDKGVVPIINENDSVAIEEIRFGDNDQLAALVCNLVSADVLIIYTDVDGLHDAPPSNGGQRIPLVDDVDEQALPVAEGIGSSGVGSGGMKSKVMAAKNAGHFGVSTVIVPGRRPQVLTDTLKGDVVGTLFVPHEDSIGSRKHWLAYGPKAGGTLVVDDGAHRALVEAGKSLLPVGLMEVRGSFAQGAVVTLEHPEKGVFARGLAGYSADELHKLCGCRSTDIEAILGYKYLDAVVHRDDLVLL